MHDIIKAETELSKIEKKQLFISLRARGMSYIKIAKELHVAKNTLVVWSAELGKRDCRGKGD